MGPQGSYESTANGTAVKQNGGKAFEMTEKKDLSKAGKGEKAMDEPEVVVEVEEEEEDPWALPELQDTDTPWSELDTKGRVMRATWLIVRFLLLLGLLYMFICSLDILSSAFRLLGGKAAGEALSNTGLFSNPIAGLMVGVLSTVLVQSSSTSTSIIVSMVSADLMPVYMAIPMVMGSNIGTTVTNTLVAIGQAVQRGDFRRAFAAATVHDMFNWLTVLIFLPIEWASRYLYHLTNALTADIVYDPTATDNPEFLKALTSPFTDKIVKLLASLLKGTIAKVLQRFMNSDLPGFLKYFTGYLAILIGAGLTILVQSSSIFTSALTPLVGVGAIHIDRMYPLTLGSNIGTTVTSILAALASDPSGFKNSFQVALCHLFFNISGILVWFPIPFMRRIPIGLAKTLGNTVFHYRWFALVYLVVMFFLLPLSVFGLSLAGWKVFLGVLLPLFLLMVFVVVVNILQTKKPSVLPSKLRSWEFLPEPLRSLAPYDRLIVRMRECCPCAKNSKVDSDAGNEKKVPS
nr:hypothetical protein BaRGS_014487 [Batillaria attramentaria]